MTQTLNAIAGLLQPARIPYRASQMSRGMSADSFAEMWNTDALGALTAFYPRAWQSGRTGRKRCSGAEDPALPAFARVICSNPCLAADQMDSAVQTANTAWMNIALTNEANKRCRHHAIQADMQNAWATTPGVAVAMLLPLALRDAYDAGTDVLNVLGEFAGESCARQGGAATFTGKMAVHEMH